MSSVAAASNKDFREPDSDAVLISLPRQLDRLAVSVSRHGEYANGRSLHWVVEHGLVRTARERARLAGTRPGSLAAHCYPSAGVDDLCLLADWITWLFILDDQNDEGHYGHDPESLERALSALYLSIDDPSLVSTGLNPLGSALRDITSRVRDRMPVTWRYRFLCHVADYFTANIWQAAQRREATAPEIDTFVHMRRNAGAIFPSFDLIELAHGAALPAPVYYSGAYQSLLTAAADVVCWTNDLMSLDKELAHGDQQNLVIVLQQVEGISLQRAADEVCARAGQQIEHFLAVEAELGWLFERLDLPSDARRTVLACVDMLRAWMSGHVAWGHDTARYLRGEQASGERGYPDDLLANGSDGARGGAA